MERMINVRYNGKEQSFPAGVCFGDIVNAMEPAPEYPALVVMEGSKLRELQRCPKEDCEIKPVTVKDKVGWRIYKRSLNFLFLKAVFDVAEKGKLDSVILNFSNSNGYFYTLKGDIIPDKDLLEKVRKQMLAMVEEKLPLRKELRKVDWARKLFRDAGMNDKDNLFAFRRVSMVNLYSIGDFTDYFYGYMVWHTGYLKHFSLELYDDGIVLVFPDRDEPYKQIPYKPFPKIFQLQKEAEKWGEQIGITTIGDLNRSITEGSIQQKILIAEALQESRISKIAEIICGRENVKFVMVAGPSSSGKTTFSRRLAIQLCAHGMTPHTVSLDNYYRNRDDCPRDENGDYDFECLEALEVPLIQQNLADLMAGKRVELPRFSFTKGTREYKGDFLQLGENDILIMEGIHGLNKKLSVLLPEDSIFRVYISALTQLNVDEHNHISTTDGRILRRIVRDYRTRGASAQETISMWTSVRKGEEKYIYPNQENADVMFNSSLIYEMAILKVYIEPLLFQVPTDSAEYVQAKKLLKFLDYLLGLPSESVPMNSLLREFIGNSCFDV